MKTINELQLAKELIKFPSITPTDAGVMGHLEKKLKSLGFKTKVLTFAEKNTKPVKNLYARLGTKGPNLCFAGHLDVVPPGNIKDWTIKPFKPAIKKGHLIGRGANDMKSSIAAFVSAVSKYISENKPNGSISLLITGDEEGVAINGTKKVVEYLKKKKEKIDFCIVGEPTNPSKLGEMIKIGRRGSMNGKLTINGVQGHVAYPHRAKNPVTTLIKIFNEFKKIKLDKGTKDFQPSNLEITRINIDNNADNVIPALASGTFNVRFNNKHSSNSIKTKLNKIIKKVTSKDKVKFEMNYRVSGEAFLSKPNSTTYMVRDVIKKITKINPKLSTTGGTSDARFIRKISPCLEFGLVGKTMHKIDEAVSLTDLKKLTQIYQNILKKYFN
ncbi:succinyl-diaminopimelate desuccinylase [Candidatus Pelagibacter sp.]|uniref:succinyl-diaminopimelate desuccinylase n=1 Tax=Candidatus Pelagibacter sp. TaxID=2024849 RepID=UPI003F850A1A